LLAERLFLWGNELLQELMFRTGSSGDVYLEPGDASNLAEVEAVWKSYARAEEWSGAGPQQGGFGLEEEEAWRASVVAHPAARLRMARTAEGRPVGYSSSMPVYAGSWELLTAHPVFAPLLAAYLAPPAVRSLPQDPGTTSYVYLLEAAAVADMAEPAQAALLRDLIGQLASGGVFFATVTAPDRKRLCEAMGFRAVEGTRTGIGPGLGEAQGYVLDLTGVGVEAWLEALIRGRPAPLALSQEDLEHEVQSVLAGWSDDAVLARSGLADVAGAGDDERASAEAVRTLVRQALEEAREASPERDVAFRAVELAYLDRSVSHERVAERLAVSRSTFYRLLKRGVRGLATTLSRRGGLSTES
jgi:hypothetical protein